MSSFSSGLPIAVFGLGYVGSVTAACLASLGHRVIGVDKDEHKVKSILAKSAPFYEPKLNELIDQNVVAGRLSATTDAAEAIRDAAVALLCVGTPSERNGNLSLEQLQRVCSEIVAHLAGRSKPLIVAVRSTVFPGTCEDVVIPTFANASAVTVVSNPEFLREGNAVQDFMEPSLVVVGGHDRASVARVAGLYESLGVTPSLVSLRTAEMIKYACNAFHALKIAFANEIGTLASQFGIPPLEVLDTLCQDSKLNISSAYLKPGFAFGGSCLPKDLRALVYRAAHQDVKVPLLESVLPSNEQHLTRAVREITELGARRLGIFGLAFKENTDDLRESPVVSMIEHLIGKGREVRIFDPHIQMDAIYGSNRNFILSAVPHIGRLLEPEFDRLLSWADHLVITQKPSAAFADSIRRSNLPALDLALSLQVSVMAS